MSEKEKLDRILEELVGSKVHIEYISSAGEEHDLTGVLKDVNRDIIELRDAFTETSIWVNRHAAVLTNVRLLKKRRKGMRKRQGLP